MEKQPGKPEPKKKEPLKPVPPEPPRADVPVRQLWAKPAPTSVYVLARTAMEEAGNAILATAFRRLAKAEANGGDFEPEDVLEWLGQLHDDIAWLQDHIRTNLHVQRDIEAFIAPERRRRCDHCQRWFLPVRTDSAYCRSACRQAAYRHRRRYG